MRLSSALIALSLCLPVIHLLLVWAGVLMPSDAPTVSGLDRKVHWLLGGSLATDCSYGEPYMHSQARDKCLAEVFRSGAPFRVFTLFLGLTQAIVAGSYERHWGRSISSNTAGPI
jgi:hypothetical protein